MKLRNSLSRKLTAMNLLVSGGALVFASIAFFAYEFAAYRTNVILARGTEAQIVAANSASPLIFNDPKSAENTLSALRASKHVTYAGVYTTKGDFFAGYWRAQTRKPYPLPPSALVEKQVSWFENGEFALAQTIEFQGKPVGIVYIRSDLDAIKERLRGYAFVLFGILAVSLIGALALSRLSQRVISQPILRLAEIAGVVSRDKKFDVRAPANGDHDEVAVLSQAFNEMLSELQKRDSDLLESERQFRTLADSIPQLAWMAEPNGDLFWYNHRWYEFTGTTPEQMRGSGWQSVHDPERLPEVVSKWRKSLASGEPFEMIFPLRGADGAYRQFLSLAMPVRDAQNRIVRWFGTNTDITEQQRSEEALRQTEKLAATGRLAASIAHEINNPLEAVTNLVYLARKQPINVEKYLKLADEELDRIAQITKNTLGFYRDSASAGEVNISRILEEVQGLYARKLLFKKIALHAEYGEEIKIAGFPGELRQIFANLIANAIEAVSENGCLAIRASKVGAQGAWGRAGVRVTFLDNGAGIAPADRKKIFEPFYTTKKDVGTGLGLWLTVGLVTKHTGSLRVRSSVEPGKTWTAFSVFLPEQPLKN